MMGTTPFDEMDRLFDQMRRSMLEGRSRAGLGGSNLRVETDEEGYVINADMPGFETDEIDLRIDDGVLILDAVHETDDDYGAGTRTRSRRVHEELRLPGQISVEDAEADYHNGVLEVRLPAETDVETGHRIDID